MTVDDLIREILAILPFATFGEDNDGQLIIYTDMMCVGGPNVPLAPFVEP